MTTQTHTIINLKNSALARYGMALALGLLMLVQQGFAQQQKTITLDEAIKLGLSNSKTLKLSQAKIDQAVSEFNQAKDRSLPTASAGFLYNRAQIPNNHLALGGPDGLTLPKSANAYLGSVSVNEAIFAGGKYKYARQSTDLLVQVARLDADRDKEEITYDIISEYYNLYKVLQSEKVVEANLKSVDQQIHQSQRFFEQGLVTKNDVLRFQLQRSNIELNGIDLESNRKIINYNLNILLGLPEDTQLTIDQLNAPTVVSASLQNYLDTAMSNRKELKQLDLRTRVAETNMKSVRADKLPTLGASAAGYYLDVAANPFPTGGNYITPLTVGLSLSWNFGTLWTNKNKEAEARIQRDQVVINKGIELDNVKDEVNRNYQSYVSALNRINLLQTSIAQATENNRLQESRYQNATGNVTDRIDAQSQLYQSQISLELAKADAGLAYYNLIKSTGTLNK
ncbi:TolC family protein [Mucilaginibacter sp. RS28]|uniref:TolC family protein n=1 Tax=Mucilaginibacter straminoryzae TaxID=2932774 RepID=A0A9X2BBQ9_9SPHI|nr:TolC family protein [Mucilaginibacter straminoryzae]MCJ8211965.1 TolC family protein [Mucilaginibacter straminoryzae]